MRFTGFLSVIPVLFLPLTSTAAEQDKHSYTPKDQITFAPATMAAFDHSGKKITHRTLADGSLATEHNGTMGNVTVARLGPDGKIETFCTTDSEAARAWMAGETGRNAVSVDVSGVEK